MNVSQHTTAMHRVSADNPRVVAMSLAGLVALVAVVQMLFACGLYGTDDVLYALRGVEIASGIWRPSDNITEIRYGISIPIAAFIRLLGRNQQALVGWSFVPWQKSRWFSGWRAARGVLVPAY